MAKTSVHSFAKPTVYTSLIQVLYAKALADSGPRKHASSCPQRVPIRSQLRLRWWQHAAGLPPRHLKPPQTSRAFVFGDTKPIFASTEMLRDPCISTTPNPERPGIIGGWRQMAYACVSRAVPYSGNDTAGVGVYPSPTFFRLSALACINLVSLFVPVEWRSLFRTEQWPDFCFFSPLGAWI